MMMIIRTGTGWWLRRGWTWERLTICLSPFGLLKLPSARSSLRFLARWWAWTLLSDRLDLSFVLNYSSISEILSILPRSFKHSVLIGHISLQFLQRVQNLTILEFESYIDGSLSILVEHLEEITSTIRSKHGQAIQGIIDCTVMQASVTISFLVEEIAFVADQDFKDFW